MLQPAEMRAQISRCLASSRTRGRPGEGRGQGAGGWGLRGCVVMGVGGFGVQSLGFRAAVERAPMRYRLCTKTVAKSRLAHLFGGLHKKEVICGYKWALWGLRSISSHSAGPI